MRRNTGPTPDTRLKIFLRDMNRCGLCGEPVTGQYSLQHRRGRGMGGSRDPQTNAASNLVLMHGSATTECHGYVEANPEEALELGFRVPQGQDPSKWAISHAVHGVVYLLDDFTFVPVAGPDEPQSEVA